MTDILPKKIKIGISACLMGQKVRYDGQHKRHDLILEILSPYCEFVPLCPEVAIGLMIPRPPIHLITQGGNVHAVGVDDSTLDVTADLKNNAKDVMAEHSDLCGYIFKSKSPSCGMNNTGLDGKKNAGANGIYAAQVQKMRPEFPMISEDALKNKADCEAFLEQLRNYSAEPQAKL